MGIASSSPPSQPEANGYYGREEIIKKVDLGDPKVTEVKFYGSSWWGSCHLIGLLEVLEYNSSVKKLVLCWTGFAERHCELLKEVLKKNTSLQSIYIKDSLTGEMVKDMVAALTWNKTVRNVTLMNSSAPILTPKLREEILRFVVDNKRLSSAELRINSLGVEFRGMEDGDVHNGDTETSPKRATDPDLPPSPVPAPASAFLQRLPACTGSIRSSIAELIAPLTPLLSRIKYCR